MSRLLFPPDLVALILSGSKTAEARNAKCDVGAIFSVWDKEIRRHRTYHVTEVKRVLLVTVANKYYKEEGCASPLEFIGRWCKRNPGEGWQAAKRVWIHFFEEVSE